MFILITRLLIIKPWIKDAIRNDFTDKLIQFRYVKISTIIKYFLSGVVTLAFKGNFNKFIFPS